MLKFRNSVLLLLATFVVSCGPEKPSEEYPGPWHEELNVGIAGVLISHQISGCGQFAYKDYVGNRPEGEPGDSEYLVYCTDGESITAYDVFVRPGRVGDVVGPDQAFPDLPPPAWWRDFVPK